MINPIEAKIWLSNDRIKKIPKTDTPISGHSLPTTEPVFNCGLYLVWFGMDNVRNVQKVV